MIQQHGNKIRFSKMTGSGNDFIIIDNFSGRIDADRFRETVKLACRPKLSVGADGVILIEKDAEVDFKWRFFNADGSEAEMCGNGARCAARFARLKGLVNRDEFSFRTLAGVIKAEMLGERVKVRMTPPHSIELDFSVSVPEDSLCLNFINSGVPHTVCLLQNDNALENADIFNLGRTLRFHERFQPAGTNVNFAVTRDRGRMAIRTYERGVEDETLACGTGSIAAALIAAAKDLVSSPVEVQTRGGETLTIHFNGNSQGAASSFEEVYLEGDAKMVYEAELWDETLK